MTFNYAQAARRHNADATLLLANQRIANADHLYGFAAECALVKIIQTLPGTEPVTVHASRRLTSAKMRS